MWGSNDKLSFSRAEHKRAEEIIKRVEKRLWRKAKIKRKKQVKELE